MPNVRAIILLLAEVLLSFGDRFSLFPSSSSSTSFCAQNGKIYQGCPESKIYIFWKKNLVMNQVNKLHRMEGIYQDYFST